MSPLSLVLSGGNALGAYHAGAWYALEAAGAEPDWIVGTSIGAVTAAIIAGSPPAGRAAALRSFWDRASAYDPVPEYLPEMLRQPLQYAQALSSRLLGRPPLFTLRVPDLSGSRPGMFDAGPMRQLVSELVDFERLNGGAMRLSILAVDLANSREVVFDTARERIGLDHVMASAALIPDFPPVEVDGRMLADGGLSANLAVHLVLEEEAERVGRDGMLTCFAVDLFPSTAPLPKGILQSSQRQSDLIFASQSIRTFRAMSQLWDRREPGADVFHMAYEATEDETSLKAYDFGSQTLSRRRAAGSRDMQAQLAVWQSSLPAHAGLHIHSIKRS